MEFGKNFYIFEVLEDYQDKLVMHKNEGRFYKNTRFIGWESASLQKVIKSNTEELVCIPIDKVKKVFKVNFEEIV